jgi:hypothetical protein
MWNEEKFKNYNLFCLNMENTIFAYHILLIIDPTEISWQHGKL